MSSILGTALRSSLEEFIASGIAANFNQINQQTTKQLLMWSVEAWTLSTVVRIDLGLMGKAQAYLRHSTVIYKSL